MKRARSWFEYVTKSLINECDTLNKLERSELKRLAEQMYKILSTKFDKYSAD